VRYLRMSGWEEGLQTKREVTADLAPALAKGLAGERVVAEKSGSSMVAYPAAMGGQHIAWRRAFRRTAFRRHLAARLNSGARDALVVPERPASPRAWR